jgi:HEAT repeat protein
LHQTSWLTKVETWRILADDQAVLQMGAADAFRVLGSQAQGAIPELSQIMNDPKQHQGAAYAACALSYLGPQAVPVLVGGLTNCQEYVRSYVANRLGSMGTNSRPALPLLIQMFNTTNHSVANAAGGVLTRLRLDPDFVVPALVSSLQDSNSIVRYHAIMALEGYFADARPAVPALLELWKDRDWTTRFLATNALRKIDPTVLEKVRGQ